MNVYIVTSGIYSDYQIEAVFSTEDLAKKYLDIHGDNNDRKIEEWDLDSEDLISKKRWYEVSIFDDNTTVGGVENGACFDSVRYNDCFGREYYEFRINTDGAERAKKIASERLTQVKAQPYLFPRLKEKCVGFNWGCNTAWKYPTYNFHTKDIILKTGEFLKE